MLTADDFHSKPTLSRTVQPSVGALEGLLRDTANKFTFVIGAGASIDSGLPTWDRLVRRITAKIRPTEHAVLADADSDEPMRKAEYVTRMAGGTTESLIEDALYQDGQPLPGQLIVSICDVLSMLGPARASIITTNFDTLIEQHLDAEGIAHSEYTLTDGAKWRSHLGGSLHSIPIMHLHGIVPHRQYPAGPVILTESHFLSYGPDARRIISDALSSTVVIFVGVSLTDPNLVGPLWDTRGAAKDAFVLIVPTHVTRTESLEDTRAYALKKAAYFESELKVDCIFLKSYGQLEQLFREMVISTSNPIDYDSSDPAVSFRYGLRLNRVIEACYGNLGSARGAFEILPTEQLNCATKMVSALDPVGEIGKLLAKYEADRHVDRQLNKLRKTRSDFSKSTEKFFLSLWLRSPASDSHEMYAINLVASTAIIPLGLEQGSIFVDVPIEGKSPILEARVLFRGVGPLTDLPRPDFVGRARGAAVSPIRIVDPVVNTEVSAVTVGALSLTSTHSYLNAPVSVLSALTPDFERDLIGHLEVLGRQLLGF